MIFKSNNLLNAIILYICIIILIIYTKPKFLYDKTNKFKQFGFNDDNKTIITFHMLSILIAILSYLLVVYINNVSQLKKNYEKILTEKMC